MLKAVQENKGLVVCQMENTNTSAQLRIAISSLLERRNVEISRSKIVQ
jgi:hypothetical protein